MNQERFERWVGALESGEYTQTYGNLRARDYDAPSGYSYCAVGVGVAEAAKELGVSPWFGSWNNDPKLYRFFENWLGVAPRTLLLHLDSGVRVSITGFNDGGAKFPEIAQRLRKEYL